MAASTSPDRDSPILDPPPLVIFGTGGSGTRAVASVMRGAGYFLGRDLNPAHDSLALAGFLERRVNWYLSRVPWIDDVLRGGTIPSEPGRALEGMIVEFREAIARHRAGIADESARWGWKNPRSIFLLPFLHQQYPRLATVHVVRDGRDMAYSENQNQLQKHGDVVLGPHRGLPDTVRSVMLWARVNMAAALYGERHLGQRYVRVRFEELCADPRAQVTRIWRALGCDPVPGAEYDAALRAINPPETIGRWRLRSAADATALLRAGEEALRKFGYLDRHVAAGTRSRHLARQIVTALRRVFSSAGEA